MGKLPLHRIKPIDAVTPGLGEVVSATSKLSRLIGLSTKFGMIL